MSKVKASSTTSTKGGNVIKPIHSYPKRIARKVAMFIFMLYQQADNGKKSGRSGGNVYMRNGRSRAMTVPALVRNIYTSTARGLMATYSAGWNLLLTDAQRTAWRNFSFQTANRFGEIKTYSGKLAYVRLNTLLVYSGQTALTNAPTSNTAPQANILEDLAISVATTSMSLSYDTNDSGAFVLVYASKPLNVGVSRPSQSALRLIGTIDTSVAGPVNLWASYVPKFGVPSLGQRVFIQTKTVRDGVGVPSAITAIDGVVLA